MNSTSARDTRQAGADMTVGVVLNRDAGGVGDASPEEVLSALQRTDGLRFATADAVPAKELFDAMQEAVSHDINALVVAGGDGTMRTAASITDSRDIPLAPLPFGTMNLLAKRLFGDREPAAILAELPAARAIDVPGGEIDGHRFFLSAAVGFPAPVAQAREALRRGAAGVASAVDAAAAALRKTGRPAISYDMKGREGRAAGLLACVGAIDALFAQDVAWASAESFEVATAQFASVSDLANLGFRAVVASWREDPSVDVCHATEVRLNAMEGGVVLDGEPFFVDAPATLTFRRRVTRALTTRPQEAMS